MKKIRIVIILIIIGIVAFFLFGEPSADSTGKHHAGLYEGASRAVVMNITASPFRGKDIDGQTIGSSTGIRVEWTSPEREYNHFLVTFTNPTTSETHTESSEHDRQSLDILPLEPETEYIVAVQACVDPYCEKWYIAESELYATTPAQYWQLDDVTYSATDEDTLGDVTDQIPEHLLGTNKEIENVSTYQVLFVEGVSYVQRLLLQDEDGNIVASATLLNP